MLKYSNIIKIWHGTTEHFESGGGHTYNDVKSGGLKSHHICEYLRWLYTVYCKIQVWEPQKMCEDIAE